MVRVLGSLLALFVALLILFLLGSSFLISSDLRRDELYDKYQNDKSFLYRIEGGATVHIRDEGNRAGPPLILLHGAYASVHAWEPWVGELGDKFRLISFDLPGYGLTGTISDGDYSRANMARTFDRIMHLMKLQRAVIVGHSMGGGVALQYELDYPEKIRGLILIGSSGMRRTADEEVPSTFGLADISWLQPILRYVTPRFMVESALRDSVADPDNFVTDEKVTRYWELIRMTGSREAMLQRQNSRDTAPPLEGRLGEITIPALLIWGAQDKLVPLAHGVRMNGAIFNSRLITYPDIGHLPMEEAPARTAAEARAFVNALGAN